MARTSSVYVRLEPKMKEQAELVLEQIGIPMSNAIALFLQQVIMQRGIPFELKLKATAPTAAGSLSDSEFNAIIEKGVADYAAGNVTSTADVRLQMNKEFEI